MCNLNFHGLAALSIEIVATFWDILQSPIFQMNEAEGGCCPIHIPSGTINDEDMKHDAIKWQGLLQRSDTN
jgi:hypothetical protein